MLIINTLLTLAVVLLALFSWRKHGDSSFLFFVFFGLLISSINIFSYLNLKLLRVSDLATNMLIAITNWYYWKKFSNSVFFYVFILTVASALVSAYYMAITVF